MNGRESPMVSLMSLWLPILLSAVIVFVASSVIHMTPLWHRNDFPKVPREAELLNALRPFDIAPGDYFIPRAAGMQEMRTPEFKEKMRQVFFFQAEDGIRDYKVTGVQTCALP